MERKKTIVAAFDFDGTITTRDSLLPFLLYTTPWWKTFYKLGRLSPSFFTFLMNKNRRQQTKEDVLTAFFQGLPIDKFCELGHAYAHSTTLKNLIHPEALRRIAWHREQKHRCIVVSAAIESYLVPWSKHIGFDDVICSQIEVSPEGTVTGKLRGLNCWGPEKVQRLTELLGPKDYILYAYGDSRGDQELLSLADYPFYRQMPS